MHALTHATSIVPGKMSSSGQAVLMAIGDDENGRALEVGFVVEGDVVTVLHVMPARPKWAGES